MLGSIGFRLEFNLDWLSCFSLGQFKVEHFTGRSEIPVIVAIVKSLSSAIIKS